MTPTVISSSGKVLLAGGYLVLDPLYPGLVISTSSRFFTVIQESASRVVAGQIHVRSPQFVDAKWDYATRVKDGRLLVEQVKHEPANKFVQLALECALSLATEVHGLEEAKRAIATGIDITIVGDNDFYSQRAKLAQLGLPRTLHALSQIPPFTPTGIRLSEVHKTGLGSSAALITSLTCALLLHFSVITPTDLTEDGGEGRRLAHNVAQYVHCLAQGKVGSGFDVSAAVFGSQVYKRFDPSVLRGLMSESRIYQGPLLPILSPSNASWNSEVQPFRLPPLTRLMLADVDAGSDTPSLVGKVLKWRQTRSSEAHALWTALDECNRALVKTLSEISHLETTNPSIYAGVVKYISTLQPLQWLANPNMIPGEEPIIKAFYEAHQITNTIRKYMREMGHATDVPIEPAEQTTLLDACVSLAGVIGGGVPGAGGYDAIWLLVTDPTDCSPEEKPLARVESVWTTWTELSVTPLAAVESAAKGARVEVLEEVPGLKDAMLES